MNFDLEEDLLEQWNSYDTYQPPIPLKPYIDSLNTLDSVYEMQNYFKPLIIDQSEYFRNRVISFEGHTDLVHCLTFSYDGKFLATGSNDHSIKVWSMSEKSLCYELVGHTSNVKCVCFSPEGLRLFSAGEDKSVRVWDLIDKKEITKFEYKGDVNLIVFSPDGETLTMALQSKDITLKIFSNGEVVDGKLSGHAEPVLSLSFDKTGKLLVSAAADQAIKVWDMATRECLVSWEYPLPVSAVAFSPDAKFVASGSFDNSIIIWNFEKKEQEGSINCQSDMISYLTFSPNGAYIASISSDNILRVFGFADRMLKFSFNWCTITLNSIAFSPDSKLLASDFGYTIAKVVNIESNIKTYFITANFKYAVARHWDNTLRVWWLQEQDHEIFIQGYDRAARCLSMSSDGKFVGSCAGQNLKVWDTNTNSIKVSYNGIETTALAFSYDSSLLATGAAGRITLWLIEEGNEFDSIFGEFHQVESLEFSPSGKFLASGLFSQVEIYNLETKKLEITLNTTPCDVKTLQFSPNEQLLMTIADDDYTRIFNLEEKKEIASNNKFSSLYWHCFFVSDTEIEFLPHNGSLAIRYNISNEQIYEKEFNKIINTRFLNFSRINSMCLTSLSWSQPFPNYIWLNDKNFTLLHYCANYGITKAIETLCEYGSFEVEKDKFNATPAHYSSQNKHSTCSKLIFEYTLSLKKKISSEAYMKCFKSVANELPRLLLDFLTASEKTDLTRTTKENIDAIQSDVPDMLIEYLISYGYDTWSKPADQFFFGNPFSNTISSETPKNKNVDLDLDAIINKLPDLIQIITNPEKLILAFQALESKKQLKLQACEAGHSFIYYTLITGHKSCTDYLINVLINHFSSENPLAYEKEFEAFANDIDVYFTRLPDSPELEMIVKAMCDFSKINIVNSKSGHTAWFHSIDNDHDGCTELLINRLDSMFLKKEEQNIDTLIEDLPSIFKVVKNPKQMAKIIETMTKHGKFKLIIDENGHSLINDAMKTENLECAEAIISYLARVASKSDLQTKIQALTAVSNDIPQILQLSKNTYGITEIIKGLCQIHKFRITLDESKHSAIFYSIQFNHHACTDYMLDYLTSMQFNPKDPGAFQESLEAVTDDLIAIIKSSINSSKTLIKFLSMCVSSKGDHIYFAVPKGQLPMVQSSTEKDTNIYDFCSEETQGVLPLKIESTRFPLSAKVCVDLLKMIQDCSVDDVFRTKFIQYLVRARWNIIKGWIIFYSILLWLNLIALVLFIRDDNYVYLGIFLMINIILFMWEIVQLCYSKMSYFSDRWNQLDIVRFIITMVWLGLKTFNDSPYQLTWVMVFLNCLRGMTGFRAFDYTRYYIRLILLSFSSITSFLVIFVYTTLCFGLLRITAQKYEVSFENLWIHSFGLGFGESIPEELKEFSLVYATFLFAIVFNVILMLNMIISILGDSFDEFQLKSEVYDNKEMTEVIIEIEQIKALFFVNTQLFHIHTLVYAYDSESYVWDGKMKDIRRYVSRIERSMNESMDKKMTAMEESLHAKIGDIDKKIDLILQSRNK
ncbi:hypothetical protein SteCoe_11738 [Stentor coeruleus]|uniref:Ion transport domain-containing protein n=1 Tax=Stentor coeruleus TaxID=5963 RepID=A0A1R2CCL2_9CILI|nr:hypothetical protein SteCoe_11738 [Stentor coeruleus]